MGRPVWVDDPRFDVAHHLRRVALPPPGGRAELTRMMGVLMGQELDRRRPLWEAWVVDGLEDGRWALISKVHHCMVDGVSGVDLMAVMLDHQPEPSSPAPDEWHPAAEPSDLRLLAAAVGDLLTQPFEQARLVRSALRRPGRAMRRAGELVGGFAALARELRATPKTSLDGTIGPDRRWVWVSVELDDVRAVRQGLGGTVNDVVLSAIAGGFRALATSRGEPPESMSLRSLVPVSRRTDETRNLLDNRVAAILFDLPLAIEDPVTRLEAVKAQMAMHKCSHEVDAGDAVTSAATFAPGVMFATAMRSAAWMVRHTGQRAVNTVTTNVPGPQFPLWLAGRRMLEYLPYVPLGQGLRFGVAMLSYDGRLAFGVTGDFDAAPDVGVLCEGIDRSLAELVGVARERRATPLAESA
jgi:diacylglycerol O-acyltransferase